MTTDNHMPLADALETLTERVRHLEHETRVPPMHEFEKAASRVLFRLTGPDSTMDEYVAACNMRDALATLIYGDE